MADSDTFIPALHKPVSLLPISRHKDALLYTIESHPVTVLVGQTGSGKTTQLPQFLEQAGWCNDGKVIAVTQASLSPSSSSLAVWLTTSHSFSLAPTGCRHYRSEASGRRETMSARPGSRLQHPI